MNYTPCLLRVKKTFFRSIPLTFSITQGILWGFISHTALYLMAGRRREIHPVMYALALVALGLLVLEHGKFS